MAGIIEVDNPTAAEVIHSNDSLNNITDLCLLHICDYLNVFDVSNLAITCQRLWKLINSFVFPNVAKTLHLKVIKEDKTVLHWDSSAVTVNDLGAKVMLFGKFVYHISFTGFGNEDVSLAYLRIFTQILKLCPNLKTLRVQGFKCNRGTETQSDYVSEMLSNVSSQLKEFHWIDSWGITNKCSIAMKRLPEIEKITVTGTNQYTGKIFEHCKKLTYLDIERYNGVYMSTDVVSEHELEKIFERNCRTLRTLKLKDFCYARSDSVYQIIARKLPNLERLEITEPLYVNRPMNLNDEFRFRRINTLELRCQNVGVNILWLMETLSIFGLIEELTIYNGHFRDYKKTDELIFKNLQKLHWHSPETSSALFLEMITLAYMPELRDFKICKWKKETNETLYFDSIVKFVKSKKSLTSLCVCEKFDPSLFAIKIVEMLKTDLSCGRPILMLKILQQIGGEEVSARQ